MAVALVVVYHFWPDRLPGGYVGVDVFFVISGFLITAHLLREVAATGTISLPRFWARRARRLLPSSLLVLAFSAVGVVLLVPKVYWQQFFKEIAASALYAQNWVLASDSVDYLAAENVSSPAQHFWSLSVEEQFYAVWPVLILAALLLARRLSPTQRRWAVFGILCLVFACSLVASIVLTASSPGQAYFVTHTRAWEFAAGGILASLGAGLTTRPVLRASVGWAGWVGIVATAISFTDHTPFPSYFALLPVVSTLAVIWAGNPAAAWSANRLLTVRPVTFVGDISYSIYLWHWPILIFAQFTFGSGMGWKARLALIGATVLLAWATTFLIENPIRQRSWLTGQKPRWTLAAAVLAMAIVVVPATGLWGSRVQLAADEMHRAQALIDAETACFGAGSIGADSDCEGVHFSTLTPDPSLAREDRSAFYDSGCYSFADDPELRSCTFGDAESDMRVALVGDSHAAQWYPPLAKLAEDEGWALTAYLKSACPQSAALKSNTVVEAYESCIEWNAALAKELEVAEEYDLVIVSHSITGTPYLEDEIQGYTEAWQGFGDAQLVVIRDTPRVPEDTNECLSGAGDDYSACSPAASTALAGSDLMVEAAEQTPGAAVIDMTDLLCTDSICPVVIGGVVVYRDSHHLTATYASTLLPALRERILAVLSR